MTRIIDLSHKLEPGKQRFKLDVKRFSVDEYVPQYYVPEGEWYIMEDLTICTHTGTHVESPYHAIKGGADIVNLDVKRFVGEAAIVDFTDKKYNDPICQNELLERGSHIKEGDILLIKTGLSKHFGTPQYKRPYIELDTIKLMVDMKIKCLGVDCSGVEDRSGDIKEVNHRELFSNGIPLMEDMNNLVELSDNRVFFFAMPMPIAGLDASSIRPIAIEPYKEGKILADMLLSKETQWVDFSWR